MDPIAAERAFRIQRPSLLRVIDCPLSLADALYSKEVLSREALDKVCTVGLSRDEKNLHLLNAVEDKIMTDSSVFQTFVDALQQEGSLRTMATRLLESYREFIDIECELKASPHSSFPPLTESPIARYARYLKDYYNTSPVSQDYKWPVTPSTRYVNLAIIKQERITRAEADEFTKATLHGNIDEIMQKKEPVLMEDVLKPIQGQRLRLVLVEGAPGVGKSTFSWELCRRWDDVEVMRQYMLIMHHSLRDEYFQKATQLDDLFFHPLSDLQQKVTQEVVAREGERTLIILDGADELPSGVRQSPRSLFNQLLSGKCIPKATVLVTTRPTATAELVSRCKPDKRIEILGFTKAQIDEYACSIFGSEPEELQAFRRYISSTPVISGMMYIPLNTAIVVEVYSANKMKERPIPTTLTQLYNDYSCILLQRYMVSTGLPENSEVSPQNIQDFPQQIRDQLTSLARLAYEGIVKQQVVFPKLPGGCTALGFTTTSAELYTGRKLSYQFLHLTLQEYLAALYISQLPVEEQKEICQRFCNQEEVVWRFLAGMTGFKDVGWYVIPTVFPRMRVMIKTKISLPPMTTHKHILLFQCLYETQDPDTCKSVLGATDICFSPHHSITPLDCYIVAYCIAHSSCTWHLDFSSAELTVGPEHIEMLAQGLKSTPPRPGAIHSLILVRYTIGCQDVEYSDLKELPLEGIVNLELTLDLHTLSTFTRDILPHIVGTLETVAIDVYSDVSTGVDPAVMKLLQTLMECRNVYSLHLGRLFYRPLIPILGCLQVCVTLDHPDTVCVTPVELAINSSLQVLHLHFFDFRSHRHRIATLLENNSNLTHVSFHDCDLGVTGAKCLAVALSRNNTLQELCVYETSLKEPWPSIGPEGAVALVRVLETNHSLKKLVLPPTCEQHFSTTHLDPRVEFYQLLRL